MHSSFMDWKVVDECLVSVVWPPAEPMNRGS